MCNHYVHVWCHISSLVTSSIRYYVAAYSSGRTKPRYALSLNWIDGGLRLRFNKVSVWLALKVINWICSSRSEL